MRKLGLSTIALVTFAGSAVMAADLPPPAAPVYRPPPVVVVPAFTWTGCYIGGNVGGAWVNTHSYDTNGVITGIAGVPLVNGDLGAQTVAGFAGGGQLGCDYQVDRFVFGIGGMIDGTSVNGTIDQPGGFFTRGPLVRNAHGARWRDRDTDRVALRQGRRSLDEGQFHPDPYPCRGGIPRRARRGGSPGNGRQRRLQQLGLDCRRRIRMGFQ